MVSSPVAYTGFWKGGGQEFQKIWEEQRSESKIVPLKFSRIFRPKLGEEQKKKKGLHSNSVRFFAQTWVQPLKNCTEHTLCVIKAYAQLAKGRAVPQFCILFYAVLQSWRPKGGAIAQCPPLNTPLVITACKWTVCKSFYYCIMEMVLKIFINTIAKPHVKIY